MLRSKSNGFLRIRQMTDVKKAIFLGLTRNLKGSHRMVRLFSSRLCRSLRSGLRRSFLLGLVRSRLLGRSTAKPNSRPYHKQQRGKPSTQLLHFLTP